MGRYTMSMLVTMAMVVVMLGTTSRLVAEAQNTADCAQDLTSCADYLNSAAKPAEACCTAIKTTVATKLSCLCNLFLTPGFLETFGSNTTQGLKIATDCGVPVDIPKCKAAIGAATPESPPAVPGVPGGNSGSGMIVWTGFPALLLFWGSIMLY